MIASVILLFNLHGGKPPAPNPVKVVTSLTTYAAIARAKGFLLVAASPLTRSSYHAGDDFKKMQAARAEQFARTGDDAAA